MKKMMEIFLHGGGFVFGDKAVGDPLESDDGYENSQICHIVRAGYNVVSMNYVLAPDYRFPVALKQLNRGLKYLRDNAGNLGLDMKKVVLAGVSAGGNLGGLLCNIQTNPEYAALVDEEPVFADGVIRGIVLEGGLLDIHRFGAVHDLHTDYLFYNMGRVYLGINDIVHDKRADISDVMSFATEKFPPAFISDGNTATFYDQAMDFDRILNELGVYSELKYYPVSQAGKLMHGYEEAGGEWSERTMEEMIVFLQKIDSE